MADFHGPFGCYVGAKTQIANRMKLLKSGKEALALSTTLMGWQVHNRDSRLG